MVNGETVGYYATAGSTFGMGPESEYKAEVIFFMTEEALNDFRERRSTKVGQHVSIPVAASGSAALSSREDRVGIIFSEDGMVSDLVMEGDRITRIAR